MQQHQNLEMITVLSLANFDEAQLAKLRAVSPRLEVHQAHPKASFDELPAALRERVEIIYGWSGALREAHRFPRLQWVQTHSAGVDYLRGDPVWESEALISSLNGVHAVPMAEYSLAMMLAFRWRLPEMMRLKGRAEWAKGRWERFALPELRGSTVGIVGYGAIGRELARQTHALGMRILAVNRSGRRSAQRGYSEPGLGDPTAALPAQIFTTAALSEMLPQCDYVVILAPLTPETRHLFDAEAFAAMKESAYLINLARGGLIDEAALTEALRQERIAGAGLDVFETEPLPPDSPLWKLDNVIISPHVSGFSHHYDERASELFAENLRRYLHHERLLNLVERERGY